MPQVAGMCTVLAEIAENWMQVMSLLVIPFPAIDPVALDFGFVSVRWYGLAYLSGLLLGWLYIKSLVRNAPLWRANTPPFAADLVDDLLIWVAAGVVLGGRLGHVIFYKPGFYIQHPMEIPAMWHGGMAFHGGLLGSILAMWLFSRRNKIAFLSVLDVTAAAVPIGIFFGRIANFINAEVFGRVSDVSWAMVFPGGGPAPRHPSQLYEGALEGLVLFLILRYMTHSRLALQRPGLVGGMFMAGYGIARSFCELFREPDPAHALLIGPLTPGMFYSMPMILVGVFFVVRQLRQPVN